MALLYVAILVILSISFGFTRLLHPLAMGLALLSQTVVVCLVAGLSSKSVWFSYVLFLIFLGAMLVLFIYVASLASNESFLWSPGVLMFLLGTVFFGIFVFTVDPLYLASKAEVYSSYFNPGEMFCSSESILSNIYGLTAMKLTLFGILYLLLTLIVVVKITSTFFGPLRLSI